MTQDTISIQARKLEKYVYTLPMAKQLNVLGRDAKNAMVDLCDLVSAVRVHVIKFETADDPKEKAENKKLAIENLDKSKEAILGGSEYELLDTADVAQLYSLAENMRERLE